MRFIFAQPCVMRFVWELEVCINRLYKLGVDKQDIVILLDHRHDELYKRLQKLGCEINRYRDDRTDISYIPSIRPYLWYQYLSEDREREKADYLYIDSDVLFSALPDIEVQDGVWYASDCNSYIGNKYIDSKGENLLQDMTKAINIDYELVRKHEKGAGAHWIITKPTADYWWKVYKDSITLHKYLSSIEQQYIKANAEGYVPIQKWTAEMWAQLWNAYDIGIDVQIHDELAFVFATDTKAAADRVKIIQNAGVTSKKKKTLFYKGDYLSKDPYLADLSYVDKNSSSYVYVQGIQEIKIMTKYKVIQGFRDKTDKVPYYVGDTFPKDPEKKVPANRIKYLVGEGLIEKVKQVEE